MLQPTPVPFIRYQASGIVLCIHFDASFMFEKEAQSHAGGHIFLSDHTADPANAITDEVSLNGPIHT
eukprot:4540044-Ditylum_brightwellii.AAC.1